MAFFDCFYQTISADYLYKSGKLTNAYGLLATVSSYEFIQKKQPMTLPCPSEHWHAPSQNEQTLDGREL